MLHMRVTPMAETTRAYPRNPRRLYQAAAQNRAAPSSHQGFQGSSHDQGRIVRLGSGFRPRFRPLAVFRYEFSSLIRACGATSLLDLPKTRSRMLIPLRVSTVAMRSSPFGRPECPVLDVNARFVASLPYDSPGIIRSSPIRRRPGRLACRTFWVPQAFPPLRWRGA